jgi:hypothetical protein
MSVSYDASYGDAIVIFDSSGEIGTNGSERNGP